MRYRNPDARSIVSLRDDPRVVFFFQAEDGIRDATVTGVQTCALPICGSRFVISSSGEPMPSDGTDCAADEYCQEGVCLKRLPEDPPPSTSQPEWVDTSN